MESSSSIFVIYIISVALIFGVLFFVSGEGQSIATVVAGLLGRSSFDFDVGFSQPIVGVHQGDQSFSVVIVHEKGKPENVLLNASGMPTGTDIIFSSPSTGIKPVSIMIINTSTETLPGDYPITVAASSKNLTKSANFTLHVALGNSKPH